MENIMLRASYHSLFCVLRWSAQCHSKRLDPSRFPQTSRGWIGQARWLLRKCQPVAQLPVRGRLHEALAGCPSPLPRHRWTSITDTRTPVHLEAVLLPQLDRSDSIPKAAWVALERQ